MQSRTERRALRGRGPSGGAGVQCPGAAPPPLGKGRCPKGHSLRTHPRSPSGTPGKARGGRARWGLWSSPGRGSRPGSRRHQGWSSGGDCAGKAVRAGRCSAAHRGLQRLPWRGFPSTARRLFCSCQLTAGAADSTDQIGRLRRTGSALCRFPPSPAGAPRRRTAETPLLPDGRERSAWRGAQKRCGAERKQQEQKKVIQTRFKIVAGFHSSLWIK